MNDKEIKYYKKKLEEAAAIALAADWAGNSTVICAVFEKIASPLFYAEEEIEEQEKPKTDFIGADVKQEPKPEPKTEDREKRIRELREMGYKPTEDPDIFVFKGAQSIWFTNIRTKESWKGE